MIEITKSKLDRKMIDEVLKEDEKNSNLNVQVGFKRHSKLKKYLASHKPGVAIRAWLRGIIDDLPE